MHASLVKDLAAAYCRIAVLRIVPLLYSAQLCSALVCLVTVDYEWLQPAANCWTAVV